MKKSTTKRSLLVSVLALVMCVTMLVGTTFAWFTDSASTSVNKIEAGRLKVDIVDADNTGTSLKGGEMSFVNKDNSANILWEPGATFKTPAFRIKNAGNLALKYKLALNGVTGDNELLDVIKFSVVKADGTEVGLDSFEGHLTPAAPLSDALYIQGYMDKEASNHYQGMTLEGIGITVYATQDTVESDSKDNLYDEKAEYAKASAPVEVKDNKVVKEVIMVSHEKRDNGVDPIAKATVPVEAVVNENTKNLELKITETDTPSNFTVENGQGARTLEVKLEGLAENNDKPVKVEIYVGEGLRSFKLYHKSDEMMAVASEAKVVRDQQYYYNAETGVVTLMSATFSPFTHTYDNNWISYAASEYATPITGKEVVIASAEELALFAKQTNAGTKYAGYTVKLTANVDLGRFMWTPINGFTGTFDGGNYTVSNLKVYSEDKSGVGFGLFGNSSATAIKNIKIHNASVYGNSAVAALIGECFTTKIDNAHVDGLIQIGVTTNSGYNPNYNSSYFGVIAGHGYPKITNCTVKGANGSAVVGGRQVGGIVGFMSETMKDAVLNCEVENIKLVGSRCVGGIAGWLHYMGNVRRCSVKNVTLEVTGWETNTIGMITGTTYTDANNGYDIFEGNTAENCTLTVAGKTVTPESPTDMYAAYAAGTHYIKRGENTIIYCESLAQAESIQIDGDMICKMP